MSGARERRSKARRAGAALGGTAAVVAVVCLSRSPPAPPRASGEELLRTDGRVRRLSLRRPRRQGRRRAPHRDPGRSSADGDRDCARRCGISSRPANSPTSTSRRTPVDGGRRGRASVLFRAFASTRSSSPGRRGLSREELRRALPYFAGSVYSAEDVADGAEALERRLVAEGFPAREGPAEVAVRPAAVRRRGHVPRRLRRAGSRGSDALRGQTGSLHGRGALRSMRRLKPGDRYARRRRRPTPSACASSCTRQGQPAGVGGAHRRATDRGRPDRARLSRRRWPGRSFVTDGSQGEERAPALARAARGPGRSTRTSSCSTRDQEKRLLQSKGYFRRRWTSYSLDQQAGPRRRCRSTSARARSTPSQKIVFSGNASVSDATLRRSSSSTPEGLPFTRGPASGSTDEPSRGTSTRSSVTTSRTVGSRPRSGRPGRAGSQPRSTRGHRSRSRRGPGPRSRNATLVGAEHTDTARRSRNCFDSKRVSRSIRTPPRDDVARSRRTTRTAAGSRSRCATSTCCRRTAARADVTYRVDEGVRSFFGKTIVRGNTTHEDGAHPAARHLDGRRAVLGGEDSRSAAPAVAHGSVSPRGRAARSPRIPPNRERNVQMEVQEARPFSLLYGFGYQYVPDAGGESQRPVRRRRRLDPQPLRRHALGGPRSADRPLGPLSGSRRAIAIRS